MKFLTIYKRVLPLWPSEILISDGYALGADSEATPGTTPGGGDKYLFPTLSEAWDDAEETIDPKKDTWGDMLVWTMYQILHGEAKRLIATGESCLKPANVPVSILEKKFRDNLNTEGWEPERDAYEGL